MTNLTSKLIVSLFIILAGFSIFGFDVVKSGKPSATIIIPKKTCSSVRRAAIELQQHIKLASGAKLEISTENNITEGNIIYLGNCNAATTAGYRADNIPVNGSRIKVSGNRMYIYGKDDNGNWLHGNTSVGTLFGVYALLNDYLGVRWLWPGPLGTSVPKSQDISLKDMSKEINLPLKNSRWRVPNMRSGWKSEATKNKFYQEQNTWLRRQRFGRYSDLEYGHAFTKYWKRFHKTNPDFFNLLPNGKREADPFYFDGRKDLISMCVSNPQLIKQIIKDWMRTRTKDHAYINANENDTRGKCTCPSCLKWDKSKVSDKKRLAEAKRRFQEGDRNWVASLGCVSNRYARFYLELLKEADKQDPEAKAKVCGLIYGNYDEPPQNVNFKKRVMLRFCPPIMFPWTEKKLNKYKEFWTKWSNCNAELIMRPNFTWDGHCFPISYAKSFAECFKFASKRNMVGADFDSLKGSFATTGPTLYMIARLQRDFKVSPEQVLEDYYSAFGPAKKSVKAYFDYLEKLSDNFAFKTAKEGIEGGRFTDFYTVAGQLFTPEVLAKCNAILNQSETEAQGNETAIKRVEFLKLGLKHSELVLECQKEFLKYSKAGKAVEFANALKHLEQFRAKHEQEFFANLGPLEHFECRNWPKNMMRLLSKNMVSLPEGWKFQWDENNTGEKKHWYAISMNDSNWNPIKIDDFWDNQLPGKTWLKEHGQAYTGIAWYRLKFNLPENAKGKKILLVFGAVDEACSIWINGKKVLDRPYPYKGDTGSWQKAFEVDITDDTHLDSPNLIAVKVINNAGKGGIWKNAYLKIEEKEDTTGKNLISNPGFENKSSGWGKNTQIGTIKFSIDRQIKNTGNTSGQMTIKQLHKSKKYAGKYGAWGRYFQKINQLTPGKKYKLSVNFRTSEDFDGKIMIWVRGGNRQDPKANIDLTWLTTNGKWQSLSAQLIPDRKTATIYLNIAANRGKVWFDDIKLSPVQEH